MSSERRLSRMTREWQLATLRRKTDRDLLILVRRALDRGLASADAAATKESRLYEEAEAAYVMIKTWLPLISGLSGDGRRDLETSRKQLRTALDRRLSGGLQNRLGVPTSGPSFGNRVFGAPR